MAMEWPSFCFVVCIWTLFGKRNSCGNLQCSLLKMPLVGHPSGTGWPWCLFPWFWLCSAVSKILISLYHAQQILDGEHCGFQNVKEWILWVFIAVGRCWGTAQGLLFSETIFFLWFLCKGPMPQANCMHVGCQFWSVLWRKLCTKDCAWQGHCWTYLGC
jgi:hypothetical protein